MEIIFQFKGEKKNLCTKSNLSAIKRTENIVTLNLKLTVLM